MATADNKRILIWDRHTRLFHWLLVMTFFAAFATGKLGDIDTIERHMMIGYVVFGLLLFRVLTGWLGKDYGHFSKLPLKPSQVIRYLRGQQVFPGHNPLGSWMIVVMLTALTLQVLSGLMTSDDIITEGPWVVWVGEQWSQWAGTVHRKIYWLLLALVLLHIGAVIFYRIKKKQDLITPMISGYKPLTAELNREQAAQAISIIRLLILIIGAFTIVWLAVNLS